MSSASYGPQPRSLFELGWASAPGAMFAFDAISGNLIDANPSAEALSGYSHEELVGMSLALLHPEDEREHAKIELLKSEQEPRRLRRFHILRKDGQCLPVWVSQSRSSELDGRLVSICFYSDISELEQKEHQLSTQSWALSAFSIAALALGRSRTAEGLLQSICEAITKQSVYVLAWVGIAENSSDKKIRAAASAGSAADYLNGLLLSWSEDDQMGHGPAGVCIRTNKLQILEDSETTPEFEPWLKRARQFGIRSCVSIPLAIEGGWRAALNVYSARPKAFETAPVEVFQHLGEQIIHGIRALNQKELLDAERQTLEKTQRHLTEALSTSVSAMVTAMEMRDPYTAGHESRTSEIAYAIGKEMGWGEDRLQGLRMAAMVHDIGKISIPVEILNKPGRLSPDEYELVKKHPETGYAILKDIPFNWPVADVVRQHHEKLDGSGYPLGLKADRILLESKVLAVADIVEAMSSHRPYRKPLGMEVVLAQIEAEAGTLLDGEVVRICAALFREERLALPGFNML
ncbi:MAG: HD domain-containing phosphohydrolase [Terracidiphilus sp.]